jgi:predicted TPR repeat methyltransferase
LEKAAECFEKAIQIDRDHAMYHYNLGLAYKGLGRMDQAIACYREAVAKKEDFLEARNNLANALIEVAADDEAIQCFRELIEMFPQSSDGNYNLANLLCDMGHHDEAITHYRRTVELNPDYSPARENLGRALTDIGRVEEAKQVWQDWQKHAPENPVARHMLASISGENIPDRCDDAFVREAFDEAFAKNFDGQLARLQYKAPELVGDALQAVDRKMANLDVLDAGCGTGLCGPIFEPIARRLVGVDLSEDMLAEARGRGTYDETIAGEITAYMNSHASSFDLIVSSDTLCYFGELRQVLGASHVCLRENGILIFTVESDLAPDGPAEYQLQPHGRYCHAETYVTKTLEDVGFSLLQLTHAVLRLERARPVNGLVVTAVRPAPP